LRWFLFGQTSDAKQLTNLALDRIVSIREKPDAYTQNVDIDFNEYFEDVIGVSVPAFAQAEKVVLLVSNELWPYIATKPLHGSQKPAKDASGGQTIELNLIVNYELISKLLSFGDGVKVMQPEHLAQNMKERLEKSFQLYQ
jgi:predicted DNA-binding transcriptional regulator YafY